MNERAVNNIEPSGKETEQEQQDYLDITHTHSLAQYIFMQWQMAKWHFNLMIRLSLLYNNNNIMLGELDKVFV